MPTAGHSCVRPESDDKNAYRPRHPEDSLLYRTIADHLETFLARQQERGREVPYFVAREMREYLSCGGLACGTIIPHELRPSGFGRARGGDAPAPPAIR